MRPILSLVRPTATRTGIPMPGGTRRRSTFTSDEDARLRMLVDSSTEVEWAGIAQQMPGRTARQCRDRWHHYLSAQLNRGPWTTEDDDLILQKYAELGSKWAAISASFADRTDVMVRNRFKALRKSGRKIPIELVLDIYKAHTCDIVKERARELNINMHLIPAGGTDLYQPLDIVVFGALKATARSEHHRFMHEDPWRPVKTKDAVRMLLYAWEHLSPGTVEMAWEIFQDPRTGDGASD